jgi:hypothetical protein
MIVAGQVVHLERPEVHWFGECEPMMADPRILIDPRLPTILQKMVAVHEIAHVRARTYKHGPRFRRELIRLWAEEFGVNLWLRRKGWVGEIELLSVQLLGLGVVCVAAAIR